VFKPLTGTVPFPITFIEGVTETFLPIGRTVVFPITCPRICGVEILADPITVVLAFAAKTRLPFPGGTCG
jgi:hypothetical protein